jgi:hypothetical protein
MSADENPTTIAALLAEHDRKIATMVSRHQGQQAAPFSYINGRGSFLGSKISRCPSSLIVKII